MINVPYYLTMDFIGDFRQLTENKSIPNGTVDKKTAQMLLEDKSISFLEDLRLPALSVKTKKTDEPLELIYNYSILFSIVMNSDAVIQLYLDFGLIPFAFYPTSHPDFINEVDEALTDNGLHHYKISARYNHSIKSIHQAMNDSWVSRIDAAEFMDCKPEDLKMTSLFRKVMNYEPY